MDRQYTYRPLNRDKSEIRLLTLFPPGIDKSFKNIPICDLHHASLLDDLSYTALSYVWGDVSDQRVILLDGIPVRVARNFYDALMALRPCKESIVLWIDALCINQSDDREKNWQVDLMKEMYSRTLKTIAWLGPADETSDSTLEYLDDFGEMAEACGVLTMPDLFKLTYDTMIYNKVSPVDQDSNQPSTKYFFNSDNPLIQVATQSLIHKVDGWHRTDGLLPIAGMTAFFQRPWWGRIWVLQESTLPEDVQLMCGAKSISRQRCYAVLAALIGIEKVISAKIVHSDRDMARRYHYAVLNMPHYGPSLMLSNWSTCRMGGLPLSRLLRATCVTGQSFPRYQNFQGMDSTKKEDKDFALLGISADKEELENMGVFPDYSKSYQMIYTSIMAALLRQGHLSLLSFCQTYGSRDDLPSWVVDWSLPLTRMLQLVKEGCVTLSPRFSASLVSPDGSRVTVLYKVDSPCGISLPACLYDEIKLKGRFPSEVSLSDPNQPVDDMFPRAARWLIETILLSYNVDGMHRDFESRLSAAVRTTTVGKERSRISVDGVDDHFDNAVGLLRRCFKFIDNDRMKSDAEMFLRTQENNTSAAVTRVNGTILYILTAAEYRIPFVTKKGHLGLSTKHVQSGDSVVVIEGAQVPFILRAQSDGRYRLICEAYVDGIMHGEAEQIERRQRIEIV